MSRAVLVGTNAFPYLINYWLKLAEMYWMDDVDTVYVAVSQPAHPSAWNWTRKYIQTYPKVKLVFTDTMWPESINQVAKMVAEDYVCLMHDDQFVLNNVVMDNHFKEVEDNDSVVTGVHAIYTPHDLVEELMVKKYPKQVPFLQEGNPYFSFYVNFTFLSTRRLKNTSMDFGEYIVKAGEYSELLDYTPTYHAITSDTNFRFNLELLRDGATIDPIKKYEFTQYTHLPDGVGQFLNDFNFKEGLFANPIPYLHLQTMAYHIGGLYYDLNLKNTLEKTKGGDIPKSIENEAGMADVPAWRADKIFKLALLQEFMMAIDYTAITKYHQYALGELNWIADRFDFDKSVIKKVRKVFHKLFTGKYE